MKLIKLVKIPVLGRLVYINPLFVESVETKVINGNIVVIKMHSGETHEIEQEIYKTMYDLQASWE